jgi:hypothetical protein
LAAGILFAFAAVISLVAWLVGGSLLSLFAAIAFALGTGLMLIRAIVPFSKR